MKTLEQVARELDALQPADTMPFQRKARAIQSLWRQEHGYPAGTPNNAPLGSRLAMPLAAHTLANFGSDEIEQVVRDEVMDTARSSGTLSGKPRIFNNLLSSQPMTFNLFGVHSKTDRVINT